MNIPFWSLPMCDSGCISRQLRTLPVRVWSAERAIAPQRDLGWQPRSGDELPEAAPEGGGPDETGVVRDVEIGHVHERHAASEADPGGAAVGGAIDAEMGPGVEDVRRARLVLDDVDRNADRESVAVDALPG